MVLPAAVLVFAAFLFPVATHLTSGATIAASQFQDRDRYVGAVLEGKRFTSAGTGEEGPPDHLVTLAGLVSAPAAVLLALLALFAKPLRRITGRRLFRVVATVFSGLRLLHSGVVCDYVTWLAAGVAAFGVLSMALLR